MGECLVYFTDDNLKALILRAGCIPEFGLHSVQSGKSNFYLGNLDSH